MPVMGQFLWCFIETKVNEKLQMKENSKEN